MTSIRLVRPLLVALVIALVTSSPSALMYRRGGRAEPEAPAFVDSDDDSLDIQRDQPESLTTQPTEQTEQEKAEYMRQVNIEKFKQTILKRLHLTAPPDLSKGGRMSNKTVARQLIRSLPLALQRRLLNQIQSGDGIIEPPADRTDEKETLILLQHLQWKLPKVSSASFAVELADEIDPSRVQSATLYFETSEPGLKGQRLEAWEIFLSAPEDEVLVDNEEESDDFSDFRFRNLTWLFEKQSNGYTSIPAPSVIRPTDFKRHHHHRRRQSVDTIRIRPGRLADSVVPSRPGLVQVSLEISGSFAHWMAYKKRRPSMKKVVRTILVVCPKCDNLVDPIDVKKGILEIRHRNAPSRRTRRSVDASVGGQSLTIGNQCSNKGAKFSCCTQSFSLNFEDVGWNNWILHPKKVEPNYCHGSCQAEGIQKTPHSDLMHIYRSQNYGQLSEVQREAMLSCCHPTKMASMSVLYVDSNNELRMNTLHNIIVLECSCS